MTDFDAEDFEVNLKAAIKLLREAFEKSEYAKIIVSFQDGRVVSISKEQSFKPAKRLKE